MWGWGEKWRANFQIGESDHLMSLDLDVDDEVGMDGWMQMDMDAMDADNEDEDEDDGMRMME